MKFKNMCPISADALKRAIKQDRTSRKLEMNKTEVPTFDELKGPTVKALKRLEGSASITVLLFSVENLSAAIRTAQRKH